MEIMNQSLQVDSWLLSSLGLFVCCACLRHVCFVIVQEMGRDPLVLCEEIKSSHTEVAVGSTKEMERRGCTTYTFWECAQKRAS